MRTTFPILLPIITAREAWGKFVGGCTNNTHLFLFTPLTRFFKTFSSLLFSVVFSTNLSENCQGLATNETLEKVVKQVVISYESGRQDKSESIYGSRVYDVPRPGARGTELQRGLW